MLGFLAVFGLLFFGGSWLLSPEPDVSPNGSPVVATLEDRDVAVVSCSRNGPRGMFQLMFQPMFQTRLSATDVATGERVWDVRIDKELSTDTRVLAAENGLVYLASDDGLYVRSLANGSAVAEPDTGHHAVVDADTVISAEPVRDGARDERLLLATGDQTVPLGDTAFTEPRFILEGTPGAPQVSIDNEQRTDIVRETETAAGRDSGYVVVLSLVGANSREYQISTVSLDTGALLDTVTDIGYSVSGAGSQNGTTVILARNSGNTGGATLVVADAAGQLTSFTVGSSGFFG